MKLKNLLAALVVIAMFAGLVTVTAVTSSANSIIWQSNKAEWDTFVAAALDEDLPQHTYLRRAGGPTIIATANGLNVTMRSADWNAIDFSFVNLEAGKSYTLEVSFASRAETQFGITQADNPWARTLMGSAGVTSETLTLEFTLDANKLFGGQNRMRLHTPGTTPDYTISKIILYGDAPAAAVAAVEEDEDDDEPVVVAATTRPAVTTAAPAAVEVIEEVEEINEEIIETIEEVEEIVYIQETSDIVEDVSVAAVDTEGDVGFFEVGTTVDGIVAISTPITVDNNVKTGVAFVVLPVLAAGAVAIVSRKRK